MAQSSPSLHGDDDEPSCNRAGSTDGPEDMEGRWGKEEGDSSNDCGLRPSSGPTTSTSKDEVDYPEGGLRAWSVVFGSFSAMVASFGMMNSVGTFQAYLSTHQLSKFNQATTGWIFSLYTFLAFFCGVQIGPIFDARGPRALICAGSVLLIASMMLLGVCTGRVLQIFLTHRANMLMADDRVLALHHRFRDPRRHWHCPYLRARRLSDQSLLSHRPWECYGHRYDWRVSRRRHIPSDAGDSFPQDWFCLEYAGDGVRLPLPARPR